MNNNNAPFYVGQRVVAVTGTIYLHTGAEYIVKDCYYVACCKKWTVSVGIKTTGTHRCGCGNVHNLTKDAVYHNYKYFAPIDEHTISIPESLKEQAEEMIQVKETIQQPETQPA